MESKGQKPSLVRTLTDRKKLEMIGVAIVLIIALLAFWPSSQSDDSASAGTQSSEVFNAEQERQDLIHILSSISGVGKVDVMITYETAPEKVPAYDQDQTTSSTVDSQERTTQNETNSQRPSTSGDGTIVLTEKRPNVLGVVVVAEGASDIGIQLTLSRAVQTALGVPNSKVEVFEMKP